MSHFYNATICILLYQVTNSAPVLKFKNQFVSLKTYSLKSETERTVTGKNTDMRGKRGIILRLCLKGWRWGGGDTCQLPHRKDGIRRFWCSRHKRLREIAGRVL